MSKCPHCHRDIADRIVLNWAARIMSRRARNNLIKCPQCGCASPHMRDHYPTCPARKQNKPKGAK